MTWLFVPFSKLHKGTKIHFILYQQSIYTKTIKIFKVNLPTQLYPSTKSLYPARHWHSNVPSCSSTHNWTHGLEGPHFPEIHKKYTRFRKVNTLDLLQLKKLERIVNISSFSSVHKMSAQYLLRIFMKKNHRMHWYILFICCGDSGVVGTHTYRHTQYLPKMTVLRPDKKNIALGVCFRVADSLFLSEIVKGEKI